MITIEDLTTPDENIANWVEDYPPAKPQAAPGAPATSWPAPAPGEPINIHFAVDPYEFMKTVYEAIRPFKEAFQALNQALRAWHAILPQPRGA